MMGTELLVVEMGKELIQQLIKVSTSCSLCKSSAEKLIEEINQLLAIIQEIRNSSGEGQLQLGRLVDILNTGLELSAQALVSKRWNVYKNLHLARKMEKLEKSVSRFMKGPLQALILAELHLARVGIDRLLSNSGLIS